jgi:AraC-like DNA-binding protein
VRPVRTNQPIKAPRREVEWHSQPGLPEQIGQSDDLPASAESGEMSAALVRIDSLRGSDSPRLAGEDPQHLRALAELEAPLPPILVHRTSMRVIDGMHRVRVAQLRGEQHIYARFFEGDEAECFVLAVQTNVQHGLPLSLADRKAAATRVIGSYPQWSDRRIAAVAGVSARTVATLRTRITNTAEHGDDEVRVGRDGRARPVDTDRRREHARKLLVDNPSLSLRAIAREVGISPETVRDVRSRMQADERAERPVHQGGRGAPNAGTAGTPRRGPAMHQHTKAHASNGVPALSMLMADPALRSTEVGRALLLTLNTSASLPRYRGQISSSVPGYCLPTIIEAAHACGQIWEDFALYMQRCAQLDNQRR